jgi:hypothetical protein
MSRFRSPIRRLFPLVMTLLPAIPARFAAADDGRGITVEDRGSLEAPAELAGIKGFDIARTPSRITFSLVTGLKPLPAGSEGVWTCFSEGLCSSTGMFYAAFSNNAAIDGDCCLYEYCPVNHRHRPVLNMARLLGTRPGEFGHGKFHGRLDEMPDGWIYLATYCSLGSEKLAPRQRADAGGRLVRFNTRTGRSEDLGLPVPGETYPMHGTDTRRGIFHAVGLLGGYLAYDVLAGRPLYQGALPADIGWSDRSILIDPNTGCCYSSDPRTGQIVRYDPHDNRFSRTRGHLPRQAPDSVEAHPGIRSYTRCRLPDGAFIAQTSGGLMFRFWPDEERVERIGANWLDGCYCPATALSRDGRYLYYVPGTHAEPVPGGPVILQMDTRTAARKVLAFLQPGLAARFGYHFGTPYSITLDATDSSLLVTWNGRRAGGDGPPSAVGEPAFTYVEIPADERPIDQKK